MLVNTIGGFFLKATYIMVNLFQPFINAVNVG